MTTFDPTQGQPAFMKALDVTRQVVARQVGGKLPMYPNVTVNVTPLTGADDLKLKTMRSDLASFTKTINTLLLEHTTFEGLKIDSLEDFQQKITAPDKQMLLALLLDASYKTLPKRDYVCPQCKEITSHELAIADILTYEKTEIHPWEEDKPVYEKTFTKKMFDDHLEVTIKYTTEKDRLQVYETISNDKVRNSLLKTNQILDSTDTLLMFVQEITIYPEKGEPIVLRNKVLDIKGYLDHSPLEVHDAITHFIDEVFDKYVQKYRAPLTCGSCGHKYDIVIDIENEFFRKALGIYG